MDYTETMALIDALNDKLRGVRPAWFTWDFLPNDWEHVLRLAHALDIEIPGQPTVKSSEQIVSMIQMIRTHSEGKPMPDYAFHQGQIDALEWVLGRHDESD